MAELPLYDSFEEQTEEACLMCAQNSDDAMKFGEKMSDDKITGDDNGLKGFRGSHVKEEVLRGSKLVRF